MSKIKIGTASWTDRSLVESGKFYPDWATSAEDRLRFYAEHFPIVEVDSTYYAMPSERNSVLWVERTPADFIFDVKSFRLFTTHQTPHSALPRSIRDELPAELRKKRNVYYKDIPNEMKDWMWQVFEGALTPLHDAGKLGIVVFQFPPWFMPNRDSFAHIEECRGRLPRYSIAVEFRNRYWLSEDNLEQTLGFVRMHGISYIAVDEPQGFRSSVPPVADVTGDYAIVRFHGRNAETWEEKGHTSSVQRFDYYYSAEELEEWVPKIRMMEQNAREVHLVMNTNRADQSVVNGRLLGERLGEGLRTEA
jgi:uncharacterized protein YecE (DUF72 family)